MPESAIQVFDRRLVRAHRERAANDFAAHDFLFREVAERLADRLADVKRRFTFVLDLGCGGDMAGAICGRDGAAQVVRSGLSFALLHGTAGAAPAVVADEEALPFAPQSFDLVTSALSLHWVNDLPGALLQIRDALKPDGLFLAAMLGGATLRELRAAWMEAELAEEGGAGFHVSPFADVRDAGSLLQRAGFALPVADTETIVATYPDAFALMRELRGMGEANALLHRRRGFTRRATLMRAAALYAEKFADKTGRIPATFQVIYLTAWAPHPSQPKALRPGSAKVRLADALGVPEQPAGDKARPR